MQLKEFVHLQVHTEYSVHEGIAKLGALVDQAKENQMNAMAITDLSNVFAWIKYYKKMIAGGVKPLIGTEFLVSLKGRSYRMIALAKNNQGYQQLIHAITYAYQHSVHEHLPMLSLDWLMNQETLEWVIISPGRQGLVEANPALISRWAETFKDSFYLGLHRLSKADKACFDASLKLASEMDLPVVALNGVCFNHKEDYEAHEARVCINHGELLGGSDNRSDFSPEQYVKSQQDMVTLFADVPQAVVNTVEISKRCTVSMKFDQTYLPEIIPEGYDSVESYFEKASKDGLELRLKQLRVEDRKPYDERLEIELAIINNMGFSSYFMIVADFIQWSKDQGIPVGPGRGSGAGSLIAYVLGITELDPLEYQLLFERFLNPERVSMPDFDIDFCMIGRDRVIEYVAQKYGRDSVAQIITYGTMAAKAVIRDVGRVMGQPYGFVDKIAKLVPFEVGMTLEKALAQEPALGDMIKQDETVAELMKLSRRLEGVIRNVGRHAGGVVIAPKPLSEFTALYCESDGSNLVTQFDKDDIEQIGLVKFDFLGLRTLTIIDWAIKNVIRRSDLKIDINTIPLDDLSTFQLLKKCSTDGVFQLESQGFKDLIRRLKPDCFEDLIALVALFRPGPLQSGMVDDFVDRKHGRAEVKYLHPALEPILSTTYGVILYQEQVMQIAQVLAGYTLGAADLLRRAMGKKKPEEMAKQRKIFLKGSKTLNIDGGVAGQIFDLMEKFAGYGFNKSHSAAYALISYQTAWLKANHTEAFMAAVLSSDMDNTDKVLYSIRATRACKCKVLSPDIHQSEYMFTVTNDKEILYGLGAIKGLGQQVIEDLISAREKGGVFKDLLDICLRVDQRLNRRTLEALIASGALDGWKIDRGILFASVNKALKHRDQVKEEQKSGQQDLFAQVSSEGVVNSFKYVDVAKWTLIERLENEKNALGFYYSGHPTQQFAKEYQFLGLSPAASLNRNPNGLVSFLGQLQGMRTLINKKGKRFAFATLVDYTGQIDVLLTEPIINEYRHLLQNDVLLVVEGTCSKDDYSGRCRMKCQRIVDLASFRESMVNFLSVELNSTSSFSEELIRMNYVFKRFQGQCEVRLKYHFQEGYVTFPLKTTSVQISDEFLKTLREIPCIKSAEPTY
ncbi:MAG TPA: DNA polymerase III subunit alpha [Gammaproteobacteria bacterium]|nr:DNA polymerase III subunit alpha [Gammaproteobacteria bacterium]